MRFFRAEPLRGLLNHDQQLQHQIQQLSTRVLAVKTVAELPSTTLERDHGYWKKRLGKQRLLAKVVYVSKEPILCFLDVLDRRSPEYAKFREDAEQYGAKHLERHCTEEEW